MENRSRRQWYYERATRTNKQHLGKTCFQICLGRENSALISLLISPVTPQPAALSSVTPTELLTFVGHFCKYWQQNLSSWQIPNRHVRVRLISGITTVDFWQFGPLAMRLACQNKLSVGYSLSAIYILAIYQSNL